MWGVKLRECVKSSGPVKKRDQWVLKTGKLEVAAKDRTRTNHCIERSDRIAERAVVVELEAFPSFFRPTGLAQEIQGCRCSHQRHDFDVAT